MVQQREITDGERTDIQTLIRFVGIYCREKHDGEKAPFSIKSLDVTEFEGGDAALCKECTKLLAYGLTMRMKCPHNPKPMCKKCETQCYHGEYKSKIREVMKYSGMYMIKHGRVDMLYHYLK